MGVVRGDGSLDLRIAPDSAVESPHGFFCVLRAGIRATNGSAAGVVLPVRTLWGEEHVCSYLDAEALAVVAVEDVDNGVAGVGLRCALHLLPSGWEDAHDRLQSIAAPLRQALARRPIENDELV